jgi:hypothetical protein
LAVPEGDSQEDRALQIAAVLADMAHWLGGPIGAILNGVVTRRRHQRLVEVLQELQAQLHGVESDAARRYVHTEDFDDLLAETLEKAVRERTEEKRRLYARLLAGTIQSPAPYDEQLEFLQVLERLQPEHLRVLAAIAREPEGSASIGGTRLGVLRTRLGGTTPESRIAELVARLNDLRLTNLTGLQTFMTMSGAEATAQTMTPVGWKLVGLLTAKPTGGQ